MSSVTSLSAEANSFLRAQIAAAALVNAPLNAALAWLSFREPTAPLFARGPCVAFDTLGTSFCLPLVTCLVLTPIVRRLARLGKAPPLVFSVGMRRTVGRLPRSTLARGLALGGLSALIAAPFVLGILAALGIDTMSRIAIVVFKGGYGALLGAAITPPVVLCAIAARE